MKPRRRSQRISTQDSVNPTQSEPSRSPSPTHSASDEAHTTPTSPTSHTNVTYQAVTAGEIRTETSTCPICQVVIPPCSIRACGVIKRHDPVIKQSQLFQYYALNDDLLALSRIALNAPLHSEDSPGWAEIGDERTYCNVAEHIWQQHSKEDVQVQSEDYNFDGKQSHKLKAQIRGGNLGRIPEIAFKCPYPACIAGDDNDDIAKLFVKASSFWAHFGQSHCKNTHFVCPECYVEAQETNSSISNGVLRTRSTVRTHFHRDNVKRHGSVSKKRETMSKLMQGYERGKQAYAEWEAKRSRNMVNYREMRQSEEEGPNSSHSHSPKKLKFDAIDSSGTQYVLVPASSIIPAQMVQPMVHAPIIQPPPPQVIMYQEYPFYPPYQQVLPMPPYPHPGTIPMQPPIIYAAGPPPPPPGMLMPPPMPQPMPPPMPQPMPMMVISDSPVIYYRPRDNYPSLPRQ